MSPLRITASQLRQQRFARKLRGYDPDEVDQLLNLTADDLESLEADCARLARRAAGLEERVEEFEEMERGLRDAMLLATEAVENAQRRAKDLLGEAESQRQALLDEGERRSRELRDEGEQRSRELLAAAEDRRRALLLEVEKLESRRSYWLSRLQSLIDDQRAFLEAHVREPELPERGGATVVQMPPRTGGATSDD